MGLLGLLARIASLWSAQRRKSLGLPILPFRLISPQRQSTSGRNSGLSLLLAFFFFVFFRFVFDSPPEIYINPGTSIIESSVHPPLPPPFAGLYTHWHSICAGYMYRPLRLLLVLHSSLLHSWCSYTAPLTPPCCPKVCGKEETERLFVYVYTVIGDARNQWLAGQVLRRDWSP